MAKALQEPWDNLTDEQRAEAEEIFQEKRDQLFKWLADEEKKIDAILKAEGRFRTGLDANNNQPEVRELSVEYRRRFLALPEECIRMVTDRTDE